MKMSIFFVKRISKNLRLAILKLRKWFRNDYLWYGCIVNEHNIRIEHSQKPPGSHFESERINLKFLPFILLRKNAGCEENEHFIHEEYPQKPQNTYFGEKKYFWPGKAAGRPTGKLGPFR